MNSLQSFLIDLLGIYAEVKILKRRTPKSYVISKIIKELIEMSEKEQKLEAKDVPVEDVKDNKPTIEGEVDLPKIDLRKYQGNKYVVEHVTLEEGKHGFYYKVLSVPIEHFGEGENAKPICASTILGLTCVDEAENKWGWGKETKTGKLLRKYEVSHPSELIGKEMITIAVEKDGAYFLQLQ